MKRIPKSELEKTHTMHHYATMRGYNRVDDYEALIPYSGKFGTGYKQLLGRHNNSTHYMVIAYWIKK